MLAYRPKIALALQRPVDRRTAKPLDAICDSRLACVFVDQCAIFLSKWL